jgi:hypothetical protein
MENLATEIFAAAQFRIAIGKGLSAGTETSRPATPASGRGNG